MVTNDALLSGDYEKHPLCLLRPLYAIRINRRDPLKTATHNGTMSVSKWVERIRKDRHKAEPFFL